VKKLPWVLILLLTLPFTLDARKADQRAGTFVMQDSVGQTVGKVITAISNWSMAQVWVDIEEESAIITFFPNEMELSQPLGPMLFFEYDDCDDGGEIYTRPELIGWGNNGWVRPKILIAPGLIEDPPPSMERIAYFPTTPEPEIYHPLSVMGPDGFCGVFEPAEAELWQVRKMKACDGEYGYDLHWCYPPPYDIIQR